MKSHALSKKQVWIIVTATIVILAILAAILVPLILSKDENIGYSFEDENKPIEYGIVHKMIFNKKLDEMLNYSFFINDKNNYIGNALLGAMSRARIPTEKMLAFADYLIELGELIKDSGFSILQAAFDKGSIKKEDNLFSDFDKYFLEFFTKTEFTEIELGRFLYEIAIDITGESEYGILLRQLGRKDFVTVTSNSIYSYNMLKTALQTGSGAAEARALQAIVYSLGTNYIDILTKLGYEGVEKLLGIAYDFDIENTRLSAEDFAIFESTMLASKGLIANIMFFAGESVKNTNAYTFELLFSYLGMENKETQEGKEKLVFSHIGLAKAMKKGLESSFANNKETGISNKDDFVMRYSQLLKEYKVFMEMTEQKEEKTNYDEYAIASRVKVQNFVDNIYSLSSIEVLSFDQMSQADFDELVRWSEELWAIADDLEDFIEQVLSMGFFNFVLKVVDIETFLKNNRRALNELIEDSLAGLINAKELEELIGQNN